MHTGPSAMAAGFAREVNFAALLLAVLLLATGVRATPLRVGLEHYEPYTFVDQLGRPQGFCIDLLREVAQQEKLELEFVEKPWSEILTDFKAGQIDLLANVGYNAERAKFIDYSIPHSNLPAGVFVRRDLGSLASFELLRGRRFAATRGALVHEWLLANHWTADILPVPTVRDGLLAVNDGRCDAVIASRLVAETYIRDARMENIVLTDFSVEGIVYEYHFGVRHGDTELLYRLNNGLAALRANGTYDRIYEKWLGPLERRTLRLKDLQPYLWPFVVVLLVVLFALFRQRRLLEQLKRQAEALRLSEDRYRRFFEEDLAGAAIATTSGRIIACNPAFAQIFGFASAGAALDTDIGALYPDREVRAALVAALQRGEKIRDCEMEMRRSDGRPVQVLVNLIGGYDERHELVEVKGYVIDTTARKRLEEELRQAQKMEAVGRLAGGVAHDFNNVLTTIIGNTELSLLRDDLPADVPASLREIKAAAQSAATLTRQLLFFSRKQVIRPEVINVNAIAAGMEKMLLRLIGADIRLTFSLDPALGWTKADPGQIEQIMLNLVVNARDAMPHGGRLAIETANTDLDQNYTRDFAGLQPGAYVKLAVSDNGSGMDAATRAHIFEPFFTTKGAGKGTGLGLSTVYGIVRQNNGHIAVFSEPGVGTTFKIFLPRVAADATPTPATPQSEEFIRGTETILLVEDNEQVCRVTVQLLRQHGYRVLVANGGAEALRLFAEEHAAIKLVLTDVIMPDMNGRQLVEQLLARKPELSTLFMSGYADDAILRQGGLGGTTGFLEKPFTQATLLRKVREAIRGA